MNYFQAEQKVLNKMSLNPSIPNEAEQTLINQEFFGKDLEKEVNEECVSKKIVYSEVYCKVESMDLGTEPEDYDLIQGEGLCSDTEEVSDEL